MTENDFTAILESFLQEQNYRIRFEVPNMGQSVDIIASQNRWITAIEAKMADWKRAIQQCKAHEIVADYICVAIATKTLSEELISETRNRGYGLIHYDHKLQRCTWAISPQRNQKIWKAQRRKFSKDLKEIACVE